MNVSDEIEKIILREGEYSNHPADRGGPTRWGITQFEARANGYNGDMKQFPIAMARAIYLSKFWRKPGFEQIAKRSEKLAAELFDAGVNMGPQTAAKFFQRSLTVLNNGGTLYPDLKVDGDIGPLSLLAYDTLVAKRGPAAHAILLRMCDSLQLVRYVEIAEANPSQEVFEWGWIVNRTGVQ